MLPAEGGITKSSAEHMTDGSTTVNYAYDSDGMRTEKTVGSTTWKYIYNGSRLVYMTNGTTNVYFRYDAEGNPMSLRYGNVNYFYLRNAQNDIIGLVDTAGAPVVQYTYDAWGNPLTVTGTKATTVGKINPLRYRSYVYDTETGLYYLGSRYYSARICRFICADEYYSTNQVIVGCNMFSYCYNNPVYYIDITGNLPYSNHLTLFDYRNIHNQVADIVAIEQASVREVFVKGTVDGKTVHGFLDVYNYSNNTYYEVKSTGASKNIRTQKQMNKYDHSALPNSNRGTVKRGTAQFSGVTKYGIWDVTYDTHPTIPGLVIYMPKTNSEREANAKAVKTIGSVIISVFFWIVSGGTVHIPVPA